MKQSTVNNSVIYASAAIFTKSLAFLLIPLYTRFLTVEEYGMLSILNVILTLVTFVFLMGVSSAAMRLYFTPNADKTYRMTLYGNAFIILVVLPAMLFVFFAPATFLLIKEFLYSIPFFPHVVLVLLVGLFTPVTSLAAAMLRVQERAKMFVIYNFFHFAVHILTVIVAVVLLGYGLKGLLYAQLLSYALFWIFAVVLLKNDVVLSYSSDISKQLLSFGIPLIPFFIFSWINTATGRVVLERFSSLTHVGIFTLAAQFSGIIALIENALENVIMPYFYKTSNKCESPDILGRFATIYFASFGLLALFIMFLSKPAVFLMASSEYHAAARYVPPLVLAAFLSILYRFFILNLMQSNRTGVLSLLTSIYTIVMLMTIYLFVIRWQMGIMGVIYSMISTEAFKNVVGYVISQRIFKIRYHIGKLCLVALVLSICAAIPSAVTTNSSIISETLFKLFILVLATLIVLWITAKDCFHYFTVYFKAIFSGYILDRYK